MSHHAIPQFDHGAPLWPAGPIGRRWSRARPAVLVTAREMALITLLLVGYFLIRGAHPDDVALSARNSLAVAHLEQRLGIFAEPAWQQAAVEHTALIRIANVIHVWGMYPVLLGAGIWLCLADIQRFRFIRRVLLISAAIGIACYWAVPQAPPRLMTGLGHEMGIVDTIHGDAAAGLRDLQPRPFLNLYAAQPSFHFAWMLLAAIGVAMAARRRWVWLLAAGFCSAMWWAIVVTGNHYFLDMIAGVLVVSLAWLIAAYTARPRHGLTVVAPIQAPARSGDAATATAPSARLTGSSPSLLRCASRTRNCLLPIPVVVTDNGVRDKK